MTIRPASRDDTAAIVDVYLDAARAGWRDFLPVDELAPNPLNFQLSVEAALAAFVAEDDGDVVGFAVASDDGELDTIFTRPSVWGRGVARALMDTALAAIRRAGHAEATLWTEERNERPRRIYEAYGWRADGTTRARDFQGVPLTELRYRIAL